MIENLIGIAYFTLVFIICAIIHRFIPKYGLAVLVSAISVPCLTAAVSLLIARHIDPFAPIALVFAFIGTAGISAIVGLPFRKKRMKNKSDCKDVMEDWSWKKSEE